MTDNEANFKYYRCPWQPSLKRQPIL